MNPAPAMRHSDEERTLALAGVFQAAALVKQVAREGAAEPKDALESSLGSLFEFDSATTADVFGGIRGVFHGLNVLRQQLDPGSKTRDLEITKYAVSLLQLERKLSRNPRMLETISRELEAARNPVEYFSLTHTNVIARLAEIYSSTLSTLGSRIMVSGEPTLLAQQDKADTIRAVLLAGIRSAVLWRQLGGSRLRLIFGRGRILGAVDTLRRQAMA